MSTEDQFFFLVPFELGTWTEPLEAPVGTFSFQFHVYGAGKPPLRPNKVKSQTE